MTQDLQAFSRRLSRDCARYRAGLALTELLRFAGWAAIALTAYALADFFLALTPRERVTLNFLLPALCGSVFAWRLWRCRRFNVKAMALAADAAAGSRRQDILSAMELTQAADRAVHPPGLLEQYLIQQAVHRASGQLLGLRFAQRWPSALLRSRLTAFLCQALAALLILGLSWRISSIVLARILHPLRDIPPYSRYCFAVVPETPQALYGAGVEIGVDIAGASVRDPVWLVTRFAGRENRAACFQESPQRFAQRLEHVVQPLEFCFAVGRARSPWRRVDLLLDPKIEEARIRIRPPAYSRKLERLFAAGEQKLTELKGALVELEVTCNRPLSRGVLGFHDREDGPAQTVREGRLTNPYQVVFDWDLEQPAWLDVAVYDVRGTRNQRPFRLEQQLAPDEPPRAILTEPPAFGLATPNAILPLEGEVEDDLELRRVDLAQALVGYRDRVQPLSLASPQRRLEFRRELNLGRLGVTPGQTLEFYLEAQDSNPDRLGMGASGIARVQIISEQEYAAHLRFKVRSDELLARYQAATDAHNQLRREVRKLEEDLAAGRLTPEQKKARWKALDTLNRQTAQAFRKAAGELQLYDMEESFHRQLEATADMLDEQQAWLADPPAFDEGYQRTLANIQDRIGRQVSEMAREQTKAEEVAKIGRLMEEALRFRQLVEDQDFLVRRLQREQGAAAPRDATLLKLLEEQQQEIRLRLAGLCASLREKAAALGDDREELSVSARAFADRADRLAIAGDMTSAEAAARNRNGGEMLRHSSLALEHLRQLFSDCQGDAFGGLAQCRLKFKVSEGMRSTLQQMLDAWSQGAGAGEDGYSMEGYSPLNVPAFGPGRARYEQAEEGKDSSRGTGARLDPGAREQMVVSPQPEAERGVGLRENVPEKYRDALEKYFGLSK